MSDNVIRDWPGLEDTIDAARDVIEEEFPQNPELLDFVVDIWAANDRMVAIACVDGDQQKFAGCTDRDCSSQWGFSCTWRISVRETLSSQTTGPVPVFSGDVRPANESALFWEISDRMVPERMGLKSAAGGHDDPSNAARRERMQARYTQIQEAKKERP